MKSTLKLNEGSPLHDAFDNFLSKTDVELLHRSIYSIFFDYLKSAPQTDTFLFKQTLSDVYLLLEFLKELNECERKDQ